MIWGGDHILSRHLHAAFPEVHHIHDLLNIDRLVVHLVPMHPRPYCRPLDDNILPRAESGLFLSDWSHAPVPLIVGKRPCTTDHHPLLQMITDGGREHSPPWRPLINALWTSQSSMLTALTVLDRSFTTAMRFQFINILLCHYIRHDWINFFVEIAKSVELCYHLMQKIWGEIV